MKKTDPGQMPLEQAAEHFASLLNEDATGEDHEKVSRWRELAPDNEAAWDRVASLWAQLEDVGDDPRIADMRRRALENADGGPAWYGRWRPMALAACAAGLAGLFGFWWVSAQHMSGTSPAQLAQVVEPEHISSGSQRKVVQLADGSTVRLNNDTEIAVAMTARGRDIRLYRGQAFFAVRKDKSRPFSVEAGALKAVAVGTAFDVRINARGASVTTTEGVVRVEPHGGGAAPKPVMVPAGTKLSMQDGQVNLARVDAQAETIWTKGLIIFDAQCLGDIAEKMNRYSQRKLKVAPSASSLTVSGTFGMGNNAAFAQALQQQGLVTVSDSGGDIILSRSRSAQPSDVACNPGTI